MFSRTSVPAACLLWAAAAFIVPPLAWGAEMPVGIENFTFVPQTLTVTAGTTVVFENKDDIPHQVVASDKSFRSKPLDTGEKFTYTFAKDGTFAYFCGLHPFMTGKIIVTK